MKYIIIVFISIIITACSTQELPPSKIESNIKSEEKLPPVIIPTKKIENIEIETNKNGTDERIIELNQTMTFYCMKKSRSSRFNSQKACENFVKQSLKTCEEKHRLVNKNLINCVKKKLKIK